MRLSILFLLFVQNDAATKLLKEKVGKMLEPFTTRFECSGVFARLVAVVTTKFAESKKKESAIDPLIDEYLDGDSARFTAAMEAVKSQFRDIIGDIDDDSVQACLPLGTNMGKFFSMSQADARLIAAAMRKLALSWSRKSSSKSITKPTPDPVAVLDIVAAVSKRIQGLFTPDQLQIAFTMNQLAEAGEEFEKGVCTGQDTQAVGEWFLRNVPAMDIHFTSEQFTSDYLPAVYRLLERFVICKFGRGGEINLLQLNQKSLPKTIEDIKQRHGVGRTRVSRDPADGVVSPPDRSVEPTTETHESIDAPISSDTSVHEKEENEYGLSHQTFITSSIAHENKLFFDNLHAAAQQLSLLGIKAVGLATQIQAIRGHLMMLELIDQHIDTLNQDHDKYTKLLVQAHRQLRETTNSNPE